MEASQVPHLPAASAASPQPGAIREQSGCLAWVPCCPRWQTLSVSEAAGRQGERAGGLDHRLAHILRLPVRWPCVGLHQDRWIAVPFLCSCLMVFPEALVAGG